MPMKAGEQDVRTYDVPEYNFRAALNVEKDLIHV